MQDATYEEVPAKKTILHLPKYKAEMWCLDTGILLTNVCLQESFFINDESKLIGRSLEGMMYGDGRRAYGSPHLKRIAQLKQDDHMLTVDLMMFVTNMGSMLKGARRTPFENEEMNQDEARSWLAETRRRLMLKLRHDRSYLRHCEKTHTTLYKHAATSEQVVKQEDIVLLLDELLKSYPPLKLRAPKVRQAEENYE